MTSKEPLALFRQPLISPIGTLHILTTDTHVCAIDFEEQPNATAPASNPLIRETKRQLTAYFDNRLQVFDLPLLPKGTDFQQRVWKALLSVPYGATASYADISKQIGQEKAVRAVGHANGQNPLPILIPCHRIIGSDGRLTGYSGGLWRKKWLLQHEGSLLQTELPF